MTRPSRTEDADVAVTGMAVLTPAGNDLSSFWATVCSGRPTAAPLTELGSQDLPVRFGCAVRDFDPVAAFGKKDARRMDRACQLAVAAGLAAIADARPADVPGVLAGIVVGTGNVGWAAYEEGVLGIVSRGTAARRNPLVIPMSMPNAAAAQLTMRTGWTGPSMTVTSSCASGAAAIGEAVRLIRDGSAEVVLAGGTEAPLTITGIGGFHLLRALSVRNDDPGRASRPFDRERDGFVLAEAAAFVLLEPTYRARARRAPAWAYVSGYGHNSDACDIVMPRADGSVAEACMRLALEDAGGHPADVQFVNAHGTSTVLNDRAEARAISALFAPARPMVTSIKGCTGHSLGAAGAVEFVATCLSLATGLVPPTANYIASEPEIDVNVVMGEGAACAAGTGLALSNSFGFGGHNVCLAVRGGERRLGEQIRGRQFG